MTESTGNNDAVVHLVGPEDGGWHHTVMRDWVAVCPDIGPTAFRLYAITRSLVIEKRGAVRKLTLIELCHLLPGPNGKPSGAGRIRDAIRELSAIGLYSTPDGHPVTTSSSKRAAERPMLIRINDFPSNPTNYSGPRNAFSVLEAIRGEAGEGPGWISNRGEGAGWKSNQGGQKSNQSGWETNQETALTSENAPPKEDSEGRLRKEDGGGHGRQASPGSSSGDGGSGSAASGNTEPLPHKAVPSSVRAVLETLPQPLVQLLEKDWPRGLPASVTALAEKALTAEQRTVAQIGERIARRWRVFGYEDALLSAEGGGLRTGLGVLEELLSPSKCWGNNLDCEDGVDVRNGAMCPRCEEERQSRRADAEPSGHPEIDAPAETFTAPTYIPAPREGAVGVNEALARDARAAILASRSTVRR